MGWKSKVAKMKTILVSSSPIHWENKKLARLLQHYLDSINSLSNKNISRCNMSAFHAMQHFFSLSLFNRQYFWNIFCLKFCDAFNASLGLFCVCVCLCMFFVCVNPRLSNNNNNSKKRISSMRDARKLTSQFDFLFPTSCRTMLFAPFDCSSNRHIEFKQNKLHFNTLKRDFFCSTIYFFLSSSSLPSFYCFSWLLQVELLYVNRQNMCAVTLSQFKNAIYGNAQRKWRQVADFWYIHFDFEHAMIYLLVDFMLNVMLCVKRFVAVTCSAQWKTSFDFFLQQQQNVAWIANEFSNVNVSNENLFNSFHNRLE